MILAIRYYFNRLTRDLLKFLNKVADSRVLKKVSYLLILPQNLKVSCQLEISAITDGQNHYVDIILILFVLSHYLFARERLGVSSFFTNLFVLHSALHSPGLPG